MFVTPADSFCRYIRACERYGLSPQAAISAAFDKVSFLFLCLNRLGC